MRGLDFALGNRHITMGSCGAITVAINIPPFHPSLRAQYGIWSGVSLPRDDDHTEVGVARSNTCPITTPHSCLLRSVRISPSSRSLHLLLLAFDLAKQATAVAEYVECLLKSLPITRPAHGNMDTV